MQWRRCWMTLYQCRRCLRAPETRHRSQQRLAESSSDPAVGAAPLALLMFAPTTWSLTCHPCWTVAYGETEGSPPTSVCRRLGLVLPKALTGNFELNILFLSKWIQGRGSPPCEVPLCTNALALPPASPHLPTTYHIPLTFKQVPSVN